LYVRFPTRVNTGAVSFWTLFNWTLWSVNWLS